MDNYSDLNKDNNKTYMDRIVSIQHATAFEERGLWRQYIKWRRLNEILGSDSLLENVPEAIRIVITQIIKEIGISHDLIVLVRRHARLDELGDTVVEGENDKANITVEIFRLIQHSKKKHKEEGEQSRNETCCLEDFFGVLLGEILNNIAFGSGNPNLVDKITKSINRNPDDIKEELYRLAINRELLPRSLIRIVDAKTPLNRLPDSIEYIISSLFSKDALIDYQSFILDVMSGGKIALNRIIESHLWLVENIVNKYVSEHKDLPRDDLIQEGSLGLIQAAEKFKPTRSARFMQYAHWWIYHAISRAIADKVRTIRIPTYMTEKIDLLVNVGRRFTQEYGRNPTDTEIAEEMNITSEQVSEIVKFSPMPLPLESQFIGMEYDPSYEDDYIYEDEDNSLINFIEYSNDYSPSSLAVKDDLTETIEKVLDTLTPREHRVIELRFGLVDGRKLTLEQVGEEFGVTRERIRQIEAKALRKLRHPTRSRKLKDYLE